MRERHCRPSPRIAAVPYAWPHNGSLSPETTALVIIDMQNDCTAPTPPIAPNQKNVNNPHTVCAPNGYLESQGYSLIPTRAVIPQILTLLSLARRHSFPVFFTREGHRPDLSDLTSRELFRSRQNPSGLGIGDPGPMGRLLVRGEEGHDIIPELQPRLGEPIVDKPGRSAFVYTDFELLLKVRGVVNLVITGVTTDVCVSSTMREANDRGFECLLVSDACGAAVERLHQGTVESVAEEGGIFGATASTAAVVEAIGKWAEHGSGDC